MGSQDHRTFWARVRPNPDPPLYGVRRAGTGPRTLGHQGSGHAAAALVSWVGVSLPGDVKLLALPLAQRKLGGRADRAAQAVEVQPGAPIWACWDALLGAPRLGSRCRGTLNLWPCPWPSASWADGPTAPLTRWRSSLVRPLGGPGCVAHPTARRPRAERGLAGGTLARRGG